VMSKLYRCGWCGLPTDKEGRVTSMFEVGRISDIDEVWKDADHVRGDCCRVISKTKRIITIDRFRVRGVKR